jgi:hypothetical protein
VYAAVSNPSDRPPNGRAALVTARNLDSLEECR